MAFGLTPAGFSARTAEDMLAEIEAAQRATLGEDLDTSAESPIGQLNAPVVTKLREVWELMAAVYASRTPPGAAYAQLDDLCAITGTRRADATKGRTTLTLTVTNGFSVAAGSVAQVDGQPGNRWVTLEPADNSGGGAPDTFRVPAEAQTAGVVAANAGTITVIATPVAGWTAVTNAEDAQAGTAAEADPPLRARREAELSRPGTAPVPAVRADLLALRDAADQAFVVACLVEENTSAYPDAYGRPPHCLEAVVQFTPGLAGGDLAAARQAVAARLWASKAGGIGTYGDHSATVTDNEGGSQTVYWSEPADVDIYVAVTLTTDPAAYAGDAAVRAAAVAYGDALLQGGDVVRMRLAAALLGVAGVADIAVLEIGTSAGTVRPLNIPIGRTQRAAFDTGRVTVTTS